MKKIFTLIVGLALSAASFAATSTTVYYAIPADVVGSNTVRVNVNRQGDGDNWYWYVMEKTDKTYFGYDIYTATFEDLYNGLGALQFQLYEGTDEGANQLWSHQCFGDKDWHTPDAYNGKLVKYNAESTFATYKYDGKFIFHVKKVDSWTPTKAYTYGDYANATWPGKDTEQNSFNSVYYDYTVTEAYTAIIFHNGEGSQTGDIDIPTTPGEYWVENGASSVEGTSTKPDGWIDYQRGSLTAGKLGTICLPYAAKVLSGGSVYKIASKVMSGDNLAYVNLTAVDALEAGHAYIFQADGTELNIQYTGTEAADAADDDGMKGNLAADAATVAQGNYVLSGNQLHKVTGDGVTAAQNRAWVTLTKIGVAEARGQFYIGFAEDATGIENVKGNENGNAPIYNLNGQRVKSTATGLYIQNGRKHIVK